MWYDLFDKERWKFRWTCPLITFWKPCMEVPCFKQWVWHVKSTRITHVNTICKLTLPYWYVWQYNKYYCCCCCFSGACQNQHTLKLLKCYPKSWPKLEVSTIMWVRGSLGVSYATLSTLPFLMLPPSKIPQVERSSVDCETYYIFQLVGKDSLLEALRTSTL